MSKYTKHTDKLHERQFDGRDGGEPYDEQLLSPSIESHFYFWCPGCNESHHFTVRPAGSTLRPAWSFDGNYSSPTFAPSLLYPSKAIRCHLFVQQGKINYCGDCDHDLKGQQSVEMVPIPFEGNII
jgi:hypothetical protein